jgi:integrase
MTKNRNRKSAPYPTASAEPSTLADVSAALDKATGLSATRLRDLKSATKRVAILLGNEPGAIALDMAAISARLAAINPIGVGLTPKRFANIRSDFLAAVKVSGLLPRKAGKLPIESQRKLPLSPAWLELFNRLSGRRAHIGLSRLARFASAHGIAPKDVNDEVIGDLVAQVREQSLHPRPTVLHRRTTLIWNEAARDPALGLSRVSVPPYRVRKRIDWGPLPAAFRQDVEDYLAWCRVTDPFAPDTRRRALAPATVRLLRDQIRAAVSALVQSGVEASSIQSIADLVTPADRLKRILRNRLDNAGGKENTFNLDLGKALVRIAHEWLEVDPQASAELKRLVGIMPAPVKGLTAKNKKFLRQFDDPTVLRRLYCLAERLWAEVKREAKPNFRTLAKAQAALAIAILSYCPIRPQNLTALAFDTHLFLRQGAGAISTLEVPAHEVKNRMELGFDIPPRVAKMLLEYRDRIVPKILGRRPTRLFVNVDGTAKNQASVAGLVITYARKRAGVMLTPHQFRHLSAKRVLDQNPGEYETVKQFLGHTSLKTTVGAYAGIDCRRAARRHQQLVEQALDAEVSAPRPKKRRT